MQLTADQRQIRALAREFARAEVAPGAAQWDRDATFPAVAVKTMADVGLLGMTAPAPYGGSDVYAAEMCERVCSAALQVYGGYGYMKDYPIERSYRDACVFQIYEGTSEVQRMIVSRAIAKGQLAEL